MRVAGCITGLRHGAVSTAGRRDGAKWRKIQDLGKFYVRPPSPRLCVANCDPPPGIRSHNSRKARENRERSRLDGVSW